MRTNFFLHRWTLIFFSLITGTLLVVYGIRVFASRSEESIDGGFVGVPTTFQEFRSCRILGKSKHTQSYYYRASDVQLDQMSWREVYCFGSEKEAKAKGYLYRRPPEDFQKK